MVIIVSRTLDSDHIADYAGLSKRSPLLAAAITLGLLSLMGVPPLVGFMGKFFHIFSQAAQHGLIWLVIIAVINSVISSYYYLKVIKTIWMDEQASEEAITASPAPRVALLLACIGIILLGMAPAIFTRATEWGARLLLPIDYV